MLAVTCRSCGQPFEAQRKTRRTCSDRCRQALHRAPRPTPVRTPRPIVYRPGDTSWRPRTPAVALLALKQRIPFDFLDLNPVEQALVRTLRKSGQGNDAPLLLKAARYRDTSFSYVDHLVALSMAVEEMTEEMTVWPQMPGRRGRPFGVASHRPIDWDWGVVLNWLLPWLFRKSLDRSILEPLVSFDRPIGAVDGEELTLLDLVAGFSPDPAVVALEHHPEWGHAYEALAETQGFMPGHPLIYSKPRGVFREQKTTQSDLERNQMNESTESPTFVERVSDHEVRLAEVERQLGIVPERVVQEAVERFIESAREDPPSR
jgi:hypothetical protein